MLKNKKGLNGSCIIVRTLHLYGDKVWCRHVSHLFQCVQFSKELTWSLLQSLIGWWWVPKDELDGQQMSKEIIAVWCKLEDYQWWMLKLSTKMRREVSFGLIGWYLFHMNYGFKCHYNRFKSCHLILNNQHLHVKFTRFENPSSKVFKIELRVF